MPTVSKGVPMAMGGKLVVAKPKDSNVDLGCRMRSNANGKIFSGDHDDHAGQNGLNCRSTKNGFSVTDSLKQTKMKNASSRQQGVQELETRQSQDVKERSGLFSWLGLREKEEFVHESTSKQAKALHSKAMQR